MAQLSPAQKIYTGVLLTAVVLWLGMKLGVPAYEYAHGKSALTVLLSQITSILGYAVIGLGMLAWLLQRIGVLPTVQPSPGTAAAAGSSVARLRNLALWIVIALLLVVLFNLFQGTKNGSDDRTVNLIITYFPVALIAGVWIFFMVRMSAKKKRDLEGGNNS
jgi:hypothetical protein